MINLNDLLSEIAKLDEKATKGPWYVANKHNLVASGSSPAGEYADVYGPRHHIPADIMAKGDAAFIALARTALPLLAKVCEWQRDSLRALPEYVDAVRRIEADIDALIEDYFDLEHAKVAEADIEKNGTDTLEEVKKRL